MLKNSRDIFHRYLVRLVPDRGLHLAKCKPANFAICKYGTADIIVAALSVIRAFGRRRFDGVIGIADRASLRTLPRGQVELTSVRWTHIANVQALFEPSYIDDEEEEEESIVRFLTALEAELAELSVGTNEYDLQRSPQPLVLTSR